MKKIIVMTICTMLLMLSVTSLAATSFSDVEGTKYQESVENLMILGLVNGFEDNTYKPYDTVTRAQMAKLMVVALGKASDAVSVQGNTSKFSDVAISNWENGYVNVAASMGIINGYPDGTFGSNNTVSYAEATTMIIRALGYEQVVSSSEESWPLNYINQAKKLSLYESIGTITASEGAKRGNIAILLWNMLRTGVCTVVSENNSGLVYGPGEVMINEYLSGFTYLSGKSLTSVDFDSIDGDATVKFSGDKSVSLTMDARDAAEKFGLKFNVLYNKSTKRVEYIQETSDNDSKYAKVTKVTSSKIYVENGNSKGYALPAKGHILYYGIDDLEEAVYANLVFENDKLEFVSAFGPEKVYFGLVIDDNITVSKRDGMEVMNYKTSSSRKYALEDEEDMPETGEIVLYYLNDDDRAVILKTANFIDSKTITSASNKKISLEGKAYTLGSSEEHVIAKVGKNTLDVLSISAIEDDEDVACFFTYAGVKYFAVYVGGTSDMEKEIAQELKTERANLNRAIKSGDAIDEESYTQETYTNLYKALVSGKEVYDKSNATLASVRNAYNTLKSKLDNLVLISSLTTAKQKTEREIVENKVDLRELVNGTKINDIVKNKANYTDATYQSFNTALNNAKTVLDKTNATSSEITTAKSNLEKAMNALVQKTEDAERTEVIANLKKALDTAASVGKKEDYTVESYDNFKTIYDEVKKVDTVTASITTMKEATTKLNNAIKLLAKNLDVSLSQLNAALLEAEDLANKPELYSTASFAKLQEAINNARNTKANTNATKENIENATKALQSAIQGLVKVDDELNKLKQDANERVKAIENALNLPESTLKEKEDKIQALSSAIEAEKKTFDTAKSNLENKIAEAKALSEADWSTLHTGSYSVMREKLATAEQTLNIQKVTSEELIAAYKALNESMV